VGAFINRKATLKHSREQLRLISNGDPRKIMTLRGWISRSGRALLILALAAGSLSAASYYPVYTNPAAANNQAQQPQQQPAQQQPQAQPAPTYYPGGGLYYVP